MALDLNRFALVSVAQIADVLYMANGQDAPWVTDGLKTGRLEATISTTAPATACSAAEGSANGDALADGTYEILVTYLRTAGSTYPEMESGANTTAASATLTGGPNEIDLTSIPTSSDAQVDARRIYIKGGTITRWRFALEIADNSTTTGTLDEDVDYYNSQDQIRESAGTYPKRRTNAEGLPPTFTHLATHQNRMWGCSGEKLYFSEVNPYHEDFPSTNELQVSVEYGVAEKITGLFSFREQLLVFTEDAVFAIEGTDLETFDPVLLMSGYGTPNTHTVVPYGGQLFWLDRQHGPVVWSGGPKPLPIGEVIEDLWNDLDQNRLRVSQGRFVPNWDLIVWLVTEGRYDRHNRAIVYDVGGQSFTYWDLWGNSLGVVRNEVGKKYLLVGNTTGDVHQWGIGFNDGAYEEDRQGTITTSQGTQLIDTAATFDEATDIEGASMVLTDSSGESLQINQVVERVSATEVKLLHPQPASVVGYNLGGIYVYRTTPWLKFDAEGPVKLVEVSTYYKKETTGITVTVSLQKQGDSSWTSLGTFDTDGSGHKKTVTGKRAEWIRLRWRWNTVDAETEIVGYKLRAIPLRGN